jgi:hypothetical protein
MALPPKGDPRRPLVLGVRSTRLFGIIFLLFGLCSSLPMLLMPRSFIGMRGAGGGVSLIVLAIYVGMPLRADRHRAIAPHAPVAPGNTL